MCEFEPYADPTFWAAHRSLMQQQRLAARPRGPVVRFSAGVRRWQRRQRILALMRDVMSGKYKNMSNQQRSRYG